jgi:hypothetical protein
MSFARFKKVIFGEKEVKTSVTKTAPVKKITTVDEHLLVIEEMTRSEIPKFVASGIAPSIKNFAPYRKAMMPPNKSMSIFQMGICWLATSSTCADGKDSTATNCFLESLIFKKL